jgi:predicted ester cyclase
MKGVAVALDTDGFWREVGAAWMDGDVSGLEHMAPDVKYHMPPVGDFDRDGLAAFIVGFREAFPDFVVTLDDTIVDGDRVVWLWHCEATFSGESSVVPVAPTGARSAASGTIVARFEGDRAVEVWHHGDWLTWLQVPLG